jgi:uncharacterized protein YcbK (DUF882 family)
MWNSKYFKRSEFACKCGCGFDTVDYALVCALDAIREHFGQPVTITSGCRCSTWNKAQGGVTGSQHVRGRAADIVVKDVHPADVAEFANTLNLGGIGVYPDFTHIDTRHGRYRW